ncbi:MAG TPA: DUF411 domain-containing protein [Woeseiaceae bacterium]|nr:DUF411 domain-containing protein [Woeseiaceae bacterium]
MRRRSFLGLLAGVAAATTVRAEDSRKATLYKNPQCGCCEDYASYLRKAGFQVAVVATHDLDAVKAQHHVPQNLYGCHTTLVGGYVVEGHVPASTIERLLQERPRIRGVSLPGMPLGSPGMTGPKTEPFRILEIGPEQRVYAVE